MRLKEKKVLNILNKKFFTIIELLVVIAILAILAAITVPTVIKVRRYSLRTSDINNLKQLSLAITMYTSDNEGYLPYIEDAPDSKSVFLLLPYLAYQIDLFYPPSIYDLYKKAPGYMPLLNNPRQIIDSVTLGDQFEPGYAYSPLDNHLNPLYDSKIESDYPIILNYNGTYHDICHVLLANGSVIKLSGTEI